MTGRGNPSDEKRQGWARARAASYFLVRIGPGAASDARDGERAARSHRLRGCAAHAVHPLRPTGLIGGAMVRRACRQRSLVECSCPTPRRACSSMRSARWFGLRSRSLDLRRETTTRRVVIIKGAPHRTLNRGDEVALAHSTDGLAETPAVFADESRGWASHVNRPTSFVAGCCSNPSSLAPFPNRVIWKRLEPLGAAVVFSQPSLTHSGPGFLNARGRGRSQNEPLPAFLKPVFGRGSVFATLFSRFRAT
jgi:hypothetical protein